MTNENCFENSEFPEQVATNTNLEKFTHLNSSEVEIASIQEVEKVFNVLFDKIIRNNKPTHNNTHNFEIIKQKLTDLYTTTNKAFWFNLSLTGCLSFMILAVISSKINSTATIPKTNILLSYFYITISLCFSILYFGLVIIKIINNIAVIKSLQQLVEQDFTQAGNEAKVDDWEIVKDIIEAANFKPEIIEYVENKINHYLIKAREDNKNTSDEFIKFIASVIVITFIEPI